MFIANEARGKEMRTTYRFSDLPSHSSVAATVTLLVCGWFTLAGAAIFTDNHSESTIAAARAAGASASAEIPAEARLTIVVEARRSAATL
jgi:hypothetical protein